MRAIYPSGSAPGSNKIVVNPASGGERLTFARSPNSIWIATYCIWDCAGSVIRECRSDPYYSRRNITVVVILQSS
jgi:hypothetical protein